MRKENFEVVLGLLVLIFLFLCSILTFKLYMFIQTLFNPVKLAAAAAVTLVSIIGIAIYYSKRFDNEGHVN